MYILDLWIFYVGFAKNIANDLVESLKEEHFWPRCKHTVNGNGSSLVYIKTWFWCCLKHVNSRNYQDFELSLAAKKCANLVYLNAPRPFFFFFSPELTSGLWALSCEVVFSMKSCWCVKLWGVEAVVQWGLYFVFMKVYLIMEQNFCQVDLSRKHQRYNPWSCKVEVKILMQLPDFTI